MADFNGSIQDWTNDGAIPFDSDGAANNNGVIVLVQTTPSEGLKQAHFNPGIDLE